MPSVLHITPHLGGGVGKVLLNLLRHAKSAGSPWRHHVRCLEVVGRDVQAAATEAALDIRTPNETSAGPWPDSLESEIAAADIVLVHWWNHPLLYRLFSNFHFPECRLLLWSHVSGFSAPQVLTRSAIDFVDTCVLATPYSLDAPAVRDLPERVRSDKVRTVFTCAGIDHVKQTQPVPHDGFVVGYVGTVDYCKLHSNFLQMSAAVPGARYVVCGGNQHNRIAAEAQELGFHTRFDFLGPVQDVAAHLAGFDVFGYPLQRQHYGSGEQALIEALAAGVPPVVFGDGAESFVVEHNKTGLVVDSTEQYTKAIAKLKRDRALRSAFSRNARQSAKARFDISTTAGAWDGVLEEAMDAPKRTRRWVSSKTSVPDAHGTHGSDLFLKSHGLLGSLWASHWESGVTSARGSGSLSAPEKGPPSANLGSADFSPLFSSKTRGSAFHYLSVFPEDLNLRQWCEWWTINEPGGQERIG